MYICICIYIYIHIYVGISMHKLHAQVQLFQTWFPDPAHCAGLEHCAGFKRCAGSTSQQSRGQIQNSPSLIHIRNVLNTPNSSIIQSCPNK